jgi:hypothetical protein
MPVSWHIAEGLVFVVSDKAATFDEWKEAAHTALDLAHSGLGGGIAAVHDARRSPLPSAQELRARVEFLEGQAEAFGLKRWAILVTRPAHFGVGRMAEMLAAAAAAEPVELRMFTDPVEAEAWARGRSEERQ